MEENVKMKFVGYYHFPSKDKQNHFFVVQCLSNTCDLSKNTNRAVMVNVFVDEDTYNYLMGMQVGDEINVQVRPDLSSGKIYYKIVL